MARPVNGGWDFVKKGSLYQYKEDGWIAMVTIMEDNSTPEEYSFTLRIEKASQKLGDDIFGITYSKTEHGDDIFGMLQLYEQEEYTCNYGYYRDKEQLKELKPEFGGVIVKLVKIDDIMENHPNVSIGNEFVGEMIEKPRVGEAFRLAHSFNTSMVVELLEDNKFKTKNSIYRWEEIK